MALGPIWLQRDRGATGLDAAFEIRAALGFRRVPAEPIVRAPKLPRRLEGLRASDMRVLRDADRVERTALDQFDRLQREVAARPLS